MVGTRGTRRSDAKVPVRIDSAHFAPLPRKYIDDDGATMQTRVFRLVDKLPGDLHHALPLRRELGERSDRQVQRVLVLASASKFSSRNERAGGSGGAYVGQASATMALMVLPVLTRVMAIVLPQYLDTLSGLPYRRTSMAMTESESAWTMPHAPATPPCMK